MCKYYIEFNFFFFNHFSFVQKHYIFIEWKCRELLMTLRIFGKSYQNSVSILYILF